MPFFKNIPRGEGVILHPLSRDRIPRDGEQQGVRETGRPKKAVLRFFRTVKCQVDLLIIKKRKQTICPGFRQFQTDAGVFFCETGQDRR